MNQRQTAAIAAAFAIVLHLAGCDRPAPAPKARETMFTDGSAKAPPVASAPLNHPSEAPPVPAPDGPPAQLAPAPAMSPDRVLALWAAAIERRDWPAVRALWGNHGADSGLSPDTFAARWSGWKQPRVKVGPGIQEGAAGSSYYTATVTVGDGARSRSGAVTLRRVNDVPGATPEQLRWHLDATTRAPWTNPG